MGIKTVAHRPYSQDLVPWDFWLFPNLRGCRYETNEEMKEAVTKVIYTLTQDDSHGVFQKFLERYNRSIEAGGDYFEGDQSFMCTISNSAHKKVWKLIYWWSYIVTKLLQVFYCQRRWQDFSFNPVNAKRIAASRSDGILFQGVIQPQANRENCVTVIFEQAENKDNTIILLATKKYKGIYVK